jgi:hypothetical protein
MDAGKTKGVRDLLLGITYELEKSVIAIALSERKDPNSATTTTATTNDFLRTASEGSFCFHSSPNFNKNTLSL